MLPEVQTIVDLIQEQGYSVEPKGFEFFEMQGPYYPEEMHGEHKAGIYGIYIDGVDVGTIREKNFVLTKYYDIDAQVLSSKERGKPVFRIPSTYCTSKGMIFLDTRGGRNHATLKRMLEANHVIVVHTMPKPEDLQDGRPIFTEDGLTNLKPN